MAGHFAVACANLDPTVLVIGRERHGRMRGDANRPGDLLAPPKICKKMLTKALARHGEIVYQQSAAPVRRCSPYVQSTDGGRALRPGLDQDTF